MLDIFTHDNQTCYLKELTNHVTRCMYVTLPGISTVYFFAEATTPVEESAHNQLSKLASITLDVARLSFGDRPSSGPPLG